MFKMFSWKIKEFMQSSKYQLVTPDLQISCHAMWPVGFVECLGRESIIPFLNVILINMKLNQKFLSIEMAKLLSKMRLVSTPVVH